MNHSSMETAPCTIFKSLVTLSKNTPCAPISVLESVRNERKHFDSHKIIILHQQGESQSAKKVNL